MTVHRENPSHGPVNERFMRHYYGASGYRAKEHAMTDAPFTETHRETGGPK